MKWVNLIIISISKEIMPEFLFFPAIKRPLCDDSFLSQTVLGSEPSLSSVNLADHGIQGLEDDDDDEMLVNRSLRSIRGSAKERVKIVGGIEQA